jgi:hypothetical protein
MIYPIIATTEGIWGTTFVEDYQIAVGKVGGTTYNSWMRFTGVTIPKGATILSAYLTLEYRNVSGDSVTVGQLISAVAADNPTNPTSNANLSSLTTANVDWSLTPAVLATMADDSPQNSPDISTIIQEIVNRSGWVSGNALILAIAKSGSYDWTYIPWQAGHTIRATLTISYWNVRYWVGNLGTWTDIAHWSLSSGGAGGASVPGENDHAIIDANSFTSAGQYILFPVRADLELTIPGGFGMVAALTKIEETPVLQDLPLAIPAEPAIAAEAKAFAVVGTATMTIASPCIVTKSSHGLSDDQEICFSSTGTLPNEVVRGISYFAKVIDLNTFWIMVAPGGLKMDTTGSSSGTHTLWVRT